MKKTKNTAKTLKTSILLVIFSLLVTTAIPVKETHTAFTSTTTDTFSVSYDRWIPTVSVSNPYFDGRCLNVYIYPALGSVKATSFTFQASKSSSMTSPTTLNLTGTEGTVQGEIKGVSLNTVYYYRARANNGLSADWSKIYSFRTSSDNLGGTYACM